MVRILLAGIAAVALGSLGGLALTRAAPEKAAFSELQPATIASATVVAPAAPADAPPKRAAEIAPTPKRVAEVEATPKADPAPSALPTPDEILKEKPEISFDGDRVSVRLGKYKIEF